MREQSLFIPEVRVLTSKKTTDRRDIVHFKHIRYLQDTGGRADGARIFLSLLILRTGVCEQASVTRNQTFQKSWVHAELIFATAEPL